jgi:RNA polymerase sigma-70 factor (ECF subfamily)
MPGVCEEAVFRKIFLTHAGALQRFLYYKFGSDNNPADLVQEAFAKLWMHCHKVSADKAKAFLFTVASNQALNEIEKKKTVLKYRNNPPKEAAVETPEYVLEEAQYMDRLQNALESLSEEQRVTFLLNRVEKKKHEEIAAMLGISRKAVEKRIYTALKKIREQMGDL